jgi:hypothetical protein
MHAILIAAIHEANAIIDRFIAADSSAPAFAAVIKMLLGKVLAAAEALAPDMRELDEFRAKAEATRVRNAACQARRRAGSPASPTRHGDEKCHGDTAPSRARSSSILEEGKIDDVDGVCARGNEKISLGLARPPIDREDLITHIEDIVKENGRWPLRPTEGWNRAVNVSIIERLLCENVAPDVILGAVRNAVGRCPYEKINGLNFFSGAIARAHERATAQLSLSLNNSNNFRPVEGSHNGRRTSVEEQLRARLAARRAEASDGDPSVGTGAEADSAVAAVENE